MRLGAGSLPASAPNAGACGAGAGGTRGATVLPSRRATPASREPPPRCRACTGVLPAWLFRCCPQGEGASRAAGRVPSGAWAKRRAVVLRACRCGDSCQPGIGVPAAAASGMIAANTMVPVWSHWQLLDALGL